MRVLRLRKWLQLTAVAAIVDGLAVGEFSAQSPSARRVLFDEAHHNIMATASGGYRPLAHLITEAGLTVMPSALAFSPERLAMADILVSANPNGAEQQDQVNRRAASAFTDLEIDAVQSWVRNGGGLLLVTDHYPTGVAARALAERFGVRLSGGWTDDPAHRRSLTGYGPIFGYLVFSRENGLLGDHPTRGRDAGERVAMVTTTTGESMQGPAGTASLLRLSPTAVDWIPMDASQLPSAPSQTPVRDFNPCPSCDRTSSAGSQGVAFDYGRGRVVVIGEMGVLIEYTVAGADNRQFTLNIIRWLAHDL
jgi:hypothetical protein